MANYGSEMVRILEEATSYSLSEAKIKENLRNIEILLKKYSKSFKQMNNLRKFYNSEFNVTFKPDFMSDLVKRIQDDLQQYYSFT